MAAPQQSDVWARIGAIEDQLRNLRLARGLGESAFSEFNGSWGVSDLMTGATGCTLNLPRYVTGQQDDIMSSVSAGAPHKMGGAGNLTAKAGRSYIGTRLYKIGAIGTMDSFMAVYSIGGALLGVTQQITGAWADRTRRDFFFTTPWTVAANTDVYAFHCITAAASGSYGWNGSIQGSSLALGVQNPMTTALSPASIVDGNGNPNPPSSITPPWPASTGQQGLTYVELHWSGT